eukprot:2848253-Rhodomonas_salina.1
MPYAVSATPYAISGTGRAYWCYAMSSTELMYGDMRQWCYAMSGTELAYAATVDAGTAVRCKPVA